ncbi:MAG: phosphoribosylamine--glycine ligase [Pseudomonadota bacterium]
MNVLLIGGGGREHALAWKLAQSPKLTKLFIAPGNPGTTSLGINSVINIDDHDAVISFCTLQAIELVVVGPEAPLVAGLVDALEAAGIAAFGPTSKAAQLEGSKGFTKDICARYDIPTAAYGRFTDRESAAAYASSKGAPIVIKADGLAAGKGVTVAMTMDEAQAAIDDCFEGAFGAAGAEVVVEQYLEGPEVSFFCLCDGKTALPLTSAQDHKRVGEGDTGPNTGGMGAYSPAPIFKLDMQADVMTTIIEPTMRAMADIGAPFKGVLYAGLMLTADGPQLIEYNVRFGDPECQVLMPRLQGDLLPLLHAAALGALEGKSISWSNDTALTVVMCAPGYPASPEKGSVINLPEDEAALIFHAGTAINGGQLIANGGRVLNAVGRGETVKQARDAAYAAVETVDWRQGFYRRDIGWRAV